MRKPLFTSLLLLLASFAFAGDDWPQFRGPDGQGHSDAQGLPTSWSETDNVKWKTPIHGRAWSSPVVLGNQIWLTTATEDGKELFAVCVDRETGKIIYDLNLFHVPNPQFAHKFNSYGSPTPVIEAGRVYVTFGSPGTACLDTKTGKVIWERTDFVCNHFRGAGSSPIIYQNLLIMNFDGSDHQFVVALDKKTGQNVWRTERSVDYKDLTPEGKVQAEGDFRKAFSTPHVATFGGKPMLISLGAKAFYAYEPLTGKEIWRIDEPANHSAATRPVIGFDMVFFPSGFSKGTLYAVNPLGQGDITTSNVVWKVTKAVANKPSPLLVDDLLYMINDGGVASCIEAKTGKEVWNERVGGNYSASPVVAEGHIYFFSEEGKSTVIETGRAFKVVSTSNLPDGFMSSPAISGRSLIVRTRTALYRLENTVKSAAK